LDIEARRWYPSKVIGKNMQMNGYDEKSIDDSLDPEASTRPRGA
jgi:hypothetical protein